MKKWGFLRKMVAVDWLFMGMEALEGYWFPKQRILSSISESKREDHQCVRKQMTELVVICKPPQYRKAPPPKWDPRPPTEESSQTNHSQQPNKTGTAFPHQQAQGTSAKKCRWQNPAFKPNAHFDILLTFVITIILAALIAILLCKDVSLKFDGVFQMIKP